MYCLLLLILQFVICQCHQSFIENSVKRFTIQFQSSLDDRQAIDEDRQRFLNYLETQDMMHDIRIRYNYSDVINGMSIEIVQPELSATNLKKSTNLDYTLSNCPYILRYWPGKKYQRPNTINEKPIIYQQDLDTYFGNTSVPLVVDGGLANLQDAHVLTTVDKAKNEGWTGQGIKVAIIDTGVDYTHPALGGCFGDGCLVAYGKDLVGDAYGQTKELKPDDDPLDQCDGHGTHVAGIIAANDTLKGFQGVSVGVTLGAYRVFGCNGDTDDDIIIAAVDMAVKAGMDIINLSLGGGYSSWQEDPLAVALSNMAGKNIVVVVAQGNEGRDGFARTPSPAIGKDLVSVGSVDNEQRLGQVIQALQSEDGKGIYEYISTQRNTFTTGGDPFLLTTLNNKTEFACESLNPSYNLTGQVIIIQRGKCDDRIKANNIHEAGGVGVLIYSNHTAITDDTQSYEIPIPVATLSYEEGTELVNLFESYHQTNQSSLPFTIQFTAKMVKVKSAGRSSAFSTWGPDPELHFKPEILAVGGFVFSTYPVNMGAYATLSGTSMATPYLAGCIALLMQATGIRDSATILMKLANYAKPIMTTMDDQGEILESPIKQGSGLVQIYDSIHGQNLVSPNTISLNDTEHFMNSTILNVTNTSNMTKLFEFNFMTTVGVNGYNFSESAVPLMVPTYHIANTNVTFQQTSIELQANQVAQIMVHFGQPVIEIQHLIHGGFIKVTAGDDIAHVPFFGTLGNQRDLPIFDSNAGYPFIGDMDGTKFTQDRKLEFNFTQGGLNVYTRIGSPTAHIKYHVLNGNSNQTLGEIPLGSNYYISRNDHSPENFDYILDWRGGINPINTNVDENEVLISIPPSNPKPIFINPHGNIALNVEQSIKETLIRVPIGTYRICATVLKIFGDPKVVKDWETWYSPLIKVIG